MTTPQPTERKAKRRVNFMQPIDLTKGRTEARIPRPLRRFVMQLGRAAIQASTTKRGYNMR